MHEDQTQRVTPPSDEAQAIAQLVVSLLEPRFNQLEARLAPVEQLVAERMNDTQPIWPQILAEIQELHVQVSRLETEQQRQATEQQRQATELAQFREDTGDNFRRLKDVLEVYTEQWLDVRADYKDLKRRVAKLEQKLEQNAA